jgi:MFS family permease
LIGLFEGFGAGTTFTSLIVLLSEVTPARLRGGAIGVYRTFMDMGGFLGPPFFMFLFSSTGYYVTFLSVIGILMFNALLVTAIKTKKKD